MFRSVLWGHVMMWSQSQIHLKAMHVWLNTQESNQRRHKRGGKPLQAFWWRLYDTYTTPSPQKQNLCCCNETGTEDKHIDPYFGAKSSNLSIGFHQIWLLIVIMQFSWISDHWKLSYGSFSVHSDRGLVMLARNKPPLGCCQDGCQVARLEPISILWKTNCS